ncbi:AbrB/MazE/SpoVT family DNA-binding domain-containing protein [candidate division KSB1 bacterium]|nr:AbrB/MazE/SpoVT family DNA-binding domain-containing protein [candidate division KSB1 bacterium]MBL7095692.1 AbrB/MazE/SpoVT family DNA-binding domain-containing protein [candidate division KSB1 bacterium]
MNEKFQTEIDEAGRIILPHEAISKLHLKPGMKLIIEVEEDKVILKPDNEESLLIEKDGVLILHAELTEDVSDIVEKVRQDRINTIIKDSLK